MAAPKSVIRAFVSQYEVEQSKYARLAHIATEAVKKKARKLEIDPQPLCTGRGKSPESLRRKLSQRNQRINHGQGYAEESEIRRDISDLAGIRVLLYFPDQADEVENVLRKAFDDVQFKPSKAMKTFEELDNAAECSKAGPYRARIYLVKVKKNDLDDLSIPNECNRVEVQVVSLLSHAWAEVEHRRYKGVIAPTAEENQVLSRLNEVMRQGEDLLTQLHSLYNARNEASRCS
ncbi:hypothetical protein BU26DRAFT_501435 [Trematosphaeria pertusa]|uniref:RelA/SpoT domain-containing protein n=1 Tax=Trematosphaeria pertusa TaxID=390896 RepID=A0A6A6IRQ6_9PLEO|nr:uncharacterized protein BU26DRAFT_501435 [Trematosphaeria pertusa]KAF2253214.1 hypothetical protein BU26DRAFT_501435 [Trematosphaeria pertusa]